MICEKCGIEITSEKVWDIHLKECNKVKTKEKVEEIKEVKKTTTKKK